MTTAVGVLIDLFLNWTPLGIIISNFEPILGFFTGLWSNITGFFSDGVTGIIEFFTALPGQIIATLGNLGSLLIGSGESLIQGFIDGISGMIGAVGDAVGGVMDFVGGFFPHSPAERGPFSGSGWTDIFDAGLAIGGNLAAGLNASSGVVGAATSGMLSPSLSGSVTISRAPTLSTDELVSSSSSPVEGLTVMIENPWTGEYLKARAVTASYQDQQRRARRADALSRGY
ncbi:hypothetical protein HQQ80_18395 [Microbacteriaceae bacterium VKM Ac-2855]|nr:hypothetical protein [Microbacteriaceae bacterium VKM Ac-2855]